MHGAHDPARDEDRHRPIDGHDATARRRRGRTRRHALLGSALAASLFVTAPALADSHRTPSAPGARVYIISPRDGAEVTSPVTIRFGLRGMGVAPAGTEKPNTGHHHLVLDGEVPPLDAPLPADEHHIHYGGGQTEVTLEIAPGEHTLQLILGDFRHIPHDPPLVSEKVTITVR